MTPPNTCWKPDQSMDSQVNAKHTHIHTYIRTYLHTYMHSSIYTYIHIPTYIHTYINTYRDILAGIHTYTHKYKHTYTRTYTHTYMRLFSKLKCNGVTQRACHLHSKSPVTLVRTQMLVKGPAGSHCPCPNMRLWNRPGSFTNPSAGLAAIWVSGKGFAGGYHRAYSNDVWIIQMCTEALIYIHTCIHTDGHTEGHACIHT